MIKSLSSIALAWSLFGSFAAAEDVRLPPPPIPLEEQERLEKFQSAERALNRMEVIVNEAVVVKTSQCMKTIGNQFFCDCLAQKSPWSIDFLQYVTIVVGSKESFNYEQMTTEQKSVFDATRLARDTCVGLAASSVKENSSWDVNTTRNDHSTRR